ncbi:hypothetical protein HYDPIDRAFT_177800 [Hydnomerulius pinastri MD-312]|uniref:Uncharacterized protein n=1 Tax=Hydnomerulius pinastri MD-312 TaxID=994086 RepID=A0A0C9W9C0_9AGAM|nr:hypothetical protein HYDPIDRAFT_177800 [Hydnomerulius pinastri MD-312]
MDKGTPGVNGDFPESLHQLHVTWIWGLDGCVIDHVHAPINPYGHSNKSHLKDTELANEINEHLQSIGTYVHTQDIVDYLDKEDMKMHYGIRKTISLATAKCWMHCMDYHWAHNFKDDMVWYCQNVFLKNWTEMEEHMHIWDDKNPEMAPNLSNPLHHCVVGWFHDKSIFYANDHHTAHWVKKGSGATSYTKGEGTSLMVAEFVSVDHGWLHSPDSKESAHVLFNAGKSHDGYFTNEDIIAQTMKAMKLVQKYFPDEDLIFDNMTTHLKCPEDALSAQKMPKYTPKEGTNWGCLYFPAGHLRVGIFKGMATILEERGYGNVKKVHAECLKFACDLTTDWCCCHCMLYNKYDFVNVKSNLELTCETQRFHVLFLPKFHCELNFIEQCWGHAKQIYRQYPPSSKEDDLEQAAWASKKYRGHCVVPDSILKDLEKANIT